MVRELKDKLTLLWSMCTCFVCSLWMWWRFYAKSLRVDDKLVFVYSMWCLHCRICMSITGLNQIYSGDSWGEHIPLLSFSCIIPLRCQTYFGTIGKPQLFVFQWRIKYASVCLCVTLSYVSLNCCSISQVSYSIPCVTFFSLVKLSLSRNTLIFWRSTLFFCSTEYFKKQKCQHGTLNPRHIWTKSCSLECFYGWGKRFVQLLLYRHSACLFINVFISQNLYPFTLKHLFSDTRPLHVLTCWAFVSIVSHWIDIFPHAAPPLLFPLALCVRSFILFFCNPFMPAIGFLRSPLEPSGWATKPALN